MLRAAEFSRVNLSEISVKLLLIDTCIECECERITIVYAVEDVDKFISRMMRGDAFLWVLTDRHTMMLFSRVIDDDDVEHLRNIDKTCGIKKMYRIERMSSDYDVVELEFNK